jgi:hypothetical protein
MAAARCEDANGIVMLLKNTYFSTLECIERSLLPAALFGPHPSSRTKTHDLSNSLKRPVRLQEGAVVLARRGSHPKYRKQPHAK